MQKKAVYTTGEAAELCKLSQQTIIRCFDNGQLRGYRVPGSRFRRIPHEALVDFMKSNQIPMDAVNSGRIRVLIVDDEAEVVELFMDVLNADGRFEVASARNGYDAGLLTREFMPDVVVLDYMLPDINGNIVCRRLRENPDLEHIRILIISGMVDPAEISELKQAGADDFIRKPFNIAQVVERIVELAHGKV